MTEGGPVLTIKQLADFVGVTVRAIRHYHARGLLPEPPRDVSGYRRYDAQAAVDLIRIKTLADAGVPLSRVQELLHADPAEFARDVEQIDARLQEEISRLQRSRERVARLGSGERLVLPAEVVDYLDRLRAVGISERTVEMERDGWMMVAARAPERVVEWITLKQRQLDVPEFRRLYRDFDRAFDVSPDDPWLGELADRFCAFLTRIESEMESVGAMADDAELTEPLVSLLDSRVLPASPAWQRLSELAAERGWTGWTRIERSVHGRVGPS